jgi:hypothetical protein
MPRRRNSRKKQRRGGGNSRPTIIKIPFCVVLKQGETKGLSYDALIVADKNKLWEGIPWRLLSVYFECATGYRQEYGGELIADPTVLQVELNTALKHNVEGVSSIRLLCSTVPQRRTLRMKAPNPWKEDEDRNQDIVMFTNIKLSDNNPSSITLFAYATMEFGPINFSTPTQVSCHTVEPKDPDDTHSVDSALSAFTALSLNIH